MFLWAVCDYAFLLHIFIFHLCHFENAVQNEAFKKLSHTLKNTVPVITYFSYAHLIKKNP